jgi:hypothetical protein
LVEAARLEALEAAISTLIQEMRTLRLAVAPELAQEAELVSALAEVFERRVFTSADALRIAKTKSPRLAAALHVLGVHRAESVGKLFARLEGRVFSAIVLHRSGMTVDGVLWEIANTNDDEAQFVA